MALETHHFISKILALRILIHPFSARFPAENITGGIVRSQLPKLLERRGEFSVKPSITKQALMLLLLLLFFVCSVFFCFVFVFIFICVIIVIGVVGAVIKRF